jgi:Tfp pilus assembly protein PilO
MNIRPYKKYILMLGAVWTVSVVLFVLACFFIIAPQMKEAARLADESAKSRQKYEQAVFAAKEENKKKLADELELMKSRLGDYAVEFEEFANLTFDISRIAADIQISAVSVKTPDQAKTTEQIVSKNLQENRIEISFESNFRQFATFLNALERHRPIVFIDKFKLSRGEGTSVGGKVDMDLAVFVKKRSEG